jgi:hypothetical protein
VKINSTRWVGAKPTVDCCKSGTVYSRVDRVSNMLLSIAVSSRQVNVGSQGADDRICCVFNLDEMY